MLAPKDAATTCAAQPVSRQGLGSGVAVSDDVHWPQACQSAFLTARRFEPYPALGQQQGSYRIGRALTVLGGFD